MYIRRTRYSNLILEEKILGKLQRLQHFQQVQLVKEKSVAYLLIIEIHNLQAIAP